MNGRKLISLFLIELELNIYIRLQQDHRDKHTKVNVMNRLPMIRLPSRSLRSSGADMRLAHRYLAGLPKCFLRSAPRPSMPGIVAIGDT